MRYSGQPGVSHWRPRRVPAAMREGAKAVLARRRGDGGSARYVRSAAAWARWIPAFAGMT